MSFLSKTAIKGLYVLPDVVFNKMYLKGKDSGFSYFFNEAYTERLLNKAKFNKNYKKTFDRIRKHKKYALIQYGRWNYTQFNICYLSDVLGSILYVLNQGYIPIVGHINNPLHEENKIYTNVWDDFFEQPSCLMMPNMSLDNAENVTPISVYDFSLDPDFRKIFDKEFVNFWHKIYKDFVVFKPDVEEYIGEEYETIMKGKKVLGCLVRGTDYVRLKPTGHPVQPNVEDIMDKCEQMLLEESLEYIYLATDEYKVKEMFDKRFPGKILTNKRRYYDKYNEDETLQTIYAVENDRENDEFYRELEYLSSLYLLSKCDSLTGGWCGGTGAAVFMNGNQYKRMEIFDLGFYD